MPVIGQSTISPDGYISEYLTPIGIVEYDMPVGFITVETRVFGGMDLDVDSGSSIQPEFGQ
jgi:hypothetical protein